MESMGGGGCELSIKVKADLRVMDVLDARRRSHSNLGADGASQFDQHHTHDCSVLRAFSHSLSVRRTSDGGGVT